jgi:hypothetical protein
MTALASRRRLEAATMSIIAPLTPTTRGTASTATRPPAAIAGGASFGDVLDGFLKEARMTPQQRIRRDVLKENNLTEDDLTAMSPAERKAIEDKIAPAIAKRVKAAEEEARRQGKQIGLPSL